MYVLVDLVLRYTRDENRNNSDEPLTTPECERGR